VPRGLRITLIVVGVLLVLALVADRISVRVAQSALADRLQSQLDLKDKPSVTAHGFPFLTQLFGGKYQDLEVTASGVTAQKVSDMSVHAHLRGVHAPFSDLSGGRLEQVPVDHVEGTVALSYDQVARAVNIPNLQINGDGQGGVRISGQLRPLGQLITASAHARAAVDSQGRLVVTADHAQVVGVRLPPAALTIVEKGLSFVLPLRDLPFGLRLTRVEATATQLELSAVADNVVLSKDALPTA
jgi:LmeA-like phospholipid-binding